MGKIEDRIGAPAFRLAELTSIRLVAGTEMAEGFGT
jgi:hypothetical protein